MTEERTPPPPPASSNSAAKWILGCLGAFLLLCALICMGFFGLGWWGYGKVKALHGDMENLSNRGQVQTLRAEARAAAPFDEANPPALTAERLDAYLSIRNQLAPSLEKHRAMIKKWSVRDQKLDDMGDFFELVKAWSELKVEHARLLARNRMSFEEYTHITRQVFGALLEKKIKPPPGLEGVSAPDSATSALIAPRLAEIQLEDWVHLDGMILATDPDRYRPASSGSGWDDD